MQEEWKVCVMHENYEVSNMGRLRHTSTKRLVPLYCRATGYVSYTTYRNGRKFSMYIHTAVALTFLGPRPKGYVIDHIDKNRANNCLDNLRYVNYSENAKNSNKCKKVPIIVSVEGLDELIQEYDSGEAAYSAIGSHRTRSVAPTMKDGVWICKTYE